MSEATPFVVCCTGFRRGDKKAISSAVTQLGGVFEGNLTQQTTHLICANAASEKYCVARREGFCHCVTRAWLTSSLEKGHFLPNVEDFTVLPFLQCVVCCTGFTSAEGGRIQRAVRQLGGSFTSDYTINVTHLVAKAARGEKFKCAHEHHALTVNVDWVFDSLQNNRLLKHIQHESIFFPNNLFFFFSLSLIYRKNG